MEEDGVLSLSVNKMSDDYLRIQNDVELNEDQFFSGAISLKSSSGSVIEMEILLVFFSSAAAIYSFIMSCIPMINTEKSIIADQWILCPVCGCKTRL